MARGVPVLVEASASVWTRAGNRVGRWRLAPAAGSRSPFPRPALIPKPALDPTLRVGLTTGPIAISF